MEQADDVELPVGRIRNLELVLTGVFRYTNTWPLAIDLIASGKVEVDSMVTGLFTLAEAEDALHAAKEASTIKAVVTPNVSV